MSTSSPTLVFVPGAWHKPVCFDKVTNILQGRYKLECVSVTLPSTTGNPAATFKDDIDVVREAICKETSQGHNVVIVAHSYGGMVGNSAIKGFMKPVDNATEGSGTSSHQIGHVVGLVLIASGFTFTGLAFMDLFMGKPPPFWRINNTTGYAELVAPPRELFYHDVPADEAEYWVSQLTNQSLKSLFEGGEFAYAGWQDVPVWYLGTIEDRGQPVVAQRMQVGMAREMGAHVQHRELRSSHSPFLSRPEQTAGIVFEAVGAFTGHPVATAKTPEDTVGGDGEVLTAVRLRELLTWYRYGLPLALGHLIGRCIIISRWCKKLRR
ncbi:hypothetical protein KVR01_008140 [Diaporthe batatas]|uniref:uncharacterized protein n=1 Tax=Diaporthe batatas TaxID=748121 RepID=UPI001D038469|nr:uncharacterized protein KVR01_008140 [Diaporthe batatas]KAG8162375.1 hypothetical protein KVR01_008140 [Diaporthe batatas]